MVAGHMKALRGETVDFAYFGCGESFHVFALLGLGRPSLQHSFTERIAKGRLSLQHPAAAYVYNLAGYVFGLLGGKEGGGRGYVLDRGRAPDGKARVAQFAGFLER